MRHKMYNIKYVEDILSKRERMQRADTEKMIRGIQTQFVRITDQFVPVLQNLVQNVAASEERLGSLEDHYQQSSLNFQSQLESLQQEEKAHYTLLIQQLFTKLGIVNRCFVDSPTDCYGRFSIRRAKG